MKWRPADVAWRYIPEAIIATSPRRYGLRDASLRDAINHFNAALGSFAPAQLAHRQRIIHLLPSATAHSISSRRQLIGRRAGLSPVIDGCRRLMDGAGGSSVDIGDRVNTAWKEWMESETVERSQRHGICCRVITSRLSAACTMPPQQRPYLLISAI